MKKWKKGMALAVSTAFVLGMVGCGTTSGEDQAASNGTVAAEVQNESTEAAAAEVSGTESEVSGDNTLKIFGDASVWLPNNETDINSSPFLLQLMEDTGVNIDLTAVSGDAQQQFNLMVAGGKENLPDIVDSSNRFEGGVAAAYANGYIIDLTDMIDEWAPNYRKYLDEHPEIDKLVKTDDGKYLSFPMIRGDDGLCSFNGLAIRKDWLDKAGLEVPTTIDEWYTALTTFKNDFGATAPLVIEATNRWHYNNFASAYGTMYDFFQNDGKVVYGPTEPGFKDFLAEMNKWYEEGLIDPNYLTADKNARDAAISSGQAGAVWTAVGGGIGKFMEAMETENPEFELVGVPTPVLNKGDRPMVGFKADNATYNGGLTITTNCKNVELAMKFLDYGYSEAGDKLFNYGTEGVSYEMVDGKPVYTELITKNPDGLTMSQAMSYYIGSSHMGGGFVQQLDYYNQYLQRPQQREAVATWADTDAKHHLLPSLTLSAEESSEVAEIDTEIWTLVDESVAGIITGTIPVDAWDDVVEEVKAMDLDRSLEIKQAALDKYNSK